MPALQWLRWGQMGANSNPIFSALILCRLLLSWSHCASGWKLLNKTTSFSQHHRDISSPFTAVQLLSTCFDIAHFVVCECAVSSIGMHMNPAQDPVSSLSLYSLVLLGEERKEKKKKKTCSPALSGDWACFLYSSFAEVTLSLTWLADTNCTGNNRRLVSTAPAYKWT